MTEVLEKPERVERAERKRYENIWWGGALIWIGLALGAEYLDILPQIGDTTEWWPWIFIGLGPWALVLNLYQLLSPAPNPNAWDWLWTVVFMGVAVGTFVDINAGIVGAAVLITIGLMVLYRASTGHD